MTRGAGAFHSNEPAVLPHGNLTPATGLVLVAFSLMLATAAPALAEPLAPDPGPVRLRIQQDTIDVPPPADGVADSLPLLADTLQADSLGALPDSLEVAEFVPRNLPARLSPVTASWGAGIWEWDREALLSTQALTVLMLLEEVPGIVPLRGGDHGQPATVTSLGSGPGRIRVYLDGIEMPPLDGGVVDLSRTGLAGLESVRVERRTGELRIDLLPLQFSDPRPYSFLEVGTGDLSTNVFRGVFAHPNALGGNILVALDRVDTEGPGGQEPGLSFGVNIRHAIFRGEKLGLAWEFRRMTSKRPEDIWQPLELLRTDWGVRGRYQWAPWLQVGAFLHRSSLSANAGENAIPDEPLVNGEPRTQLGAHLSVVRGNWWAEAEYRSQGGPGWPSSDQTLRAGGTLARAGGGSLAIERQGWGDGQTAVSIHGRAWTRPMFGFYLFGELESGGLGVPFWVPPEMVGDSIDQPPPPSVDVSFTDRTGIRAGLEYRRGDVLVGAALLSIDADSLHPVGLPTDRNGLPTVGGSRSGFELSASFPLEWVVNGLSVRGSAQLWDQTQTWRYLPERVYHARLAYRDVFFESGNLEVWADLGARGRDPMQVPSEILGSPETVPFQQSWFARLQLRVSSVRVFFLLENLTLRDNNQDYPGRILPRTRSMYGIRWTMWN